MARNKEIAGPVRAVRRGRPSLRTRRFLQKRGGRGGPPLQDMLIPLKKPLVQTTGW